MVVVVMADQLPLGAAVCLNMTPVSDSSVAHVEGVPCARLRPKANQVQKRDLDHATMGNNRGMYDAHLHFEMRKNLNIGIDRTMFARDYSNYWSPRDFIGERRGLKGGLGGYPVAINTFNARPDRALYAPVDDSQLSNSEARALRAGYSRPSGIKKRGGWRVSRY
jgi:hypothetical protein